jgi:hypothetical protein
LKTTFFFARCDFYFASFFALNKQKIKSLRSRASEHISCCETRYQILWHRSATLADDFVEVAESGQKNELLLHDISFAKVFRESLY